MKSTLPLPFAKAAKGKGNAYRNLITGMAELACGANGGQIWTFGTRRIDGRAQFYAEVEAMGGRRWDTSSSFARMEKLRGKP